MANPLSSPVLTVKEVAEYLRIHPSTLMRLRKRGKFAPSFKVGRDIRYRLDAIDEWRKAQEKGAA